MTNETVVAKSLITSIISAQEDMMGPIAFEVAKAAGVTLAKNGVISISGDPKIVSEKLVSLYNQVFGKASLEVSKIAVQRLGVAKSFIPKSLQ